MSEPADVGAKASKAGARLQAITFDVGGTLMECHPSVGHVYCDVARRHGCLNLTAELLNHRFKGAWSRLKDFNHTVQEWSRLVDETFDGLVYPAPSATFFPELYDRFSDPAVWRVFDDVMPALAALKSSGYRLGIVSNWDDRLRPLLRALRLDGWFDSIIISCEAGASKPASEVFQTACAALGAELNATLHVGDSWVHDVDGARFAGLRALWLRRERRGLGNGEIGSLLELNKI